MKSELQPYERDKQSSSTDFILADHFSTVPSEIKLIIVKFAIDKQLIENDIFNALYSSKRYIVGLLLVNKDFFAFFQDFYSELIQYSYEKTIKLFASEESKLNVEQLNALLTNILLAQFNSNIENKPNYNEKLEQCAKYFIAGANPNVMSSLNFCRWEDNQNKPILVNILIFVISRKPLHKLIPLLIAKEVLINETETEGTTSLAEALDYPEIVNLLLRHKANINTKNKAGMSSLDFLAMDFKFKFSCQFKYYKNKPILEVLKLFIKHNPELLERIENQEVKDINYSILIDLLNSDKS